MKGEKEPHGMKHRVHVEKAKERRRFLVFTVVVAILLVSVSGFLTYSALTPSSPSQEANLSSQPKAAIVDQLSLTFPNQTFVESAKSILKQAGYAVDYFGRGKVTVDFYRNLPSYGYRLIILRVHSGTITSQSGELVTLFTSELYDRNKYVLEQLAGQVMEVSHFVDDQTYYFGINQKFVEDSMKGTFRGTVIIMMGCRGLPSKSIAESFVGKGAKVYIGWDGAVLASHTDEATMCLLQHLINGKEPIMQAVADTMKEVGPDPTSNGRLSYYPIEAGEQTIEEGSKGK